MNSLMCPLIQSAEERCSEFVFKMFGGRCEWSTTLYCMSMSFRLLVQQRESGKNHRSKNVDVKINNYECITYQELADTGA